MRKYEKQRHELEEKKKEEEDCNVEKEKITREI